MDILKKFFPYSFGVKDLTDMIVKIIVYVVVGAVAGVLIGLLAKLPGYPGSLQGPEVIDHLHKKRTQSVLFFIWFHALIDRLVVLIGIAFPRKEQCSVQCIYGHLLTVFGATTDNLPLL